MLLNYVKLAVGLLLRNPFFGIIDVAGLVVGFAVFFVPWHFTVSELRSKRFIKDHERDTGRRLCLSLSQWHSGPLQEVN